MSFLQRVCSALEGARVRYALVGGYAVALHGAVRGTIDVDIALLWNRRSLRAAQTALTEIGLVSRLPVGADEVHEFRDEFIRNRNMIAWNFYHPNDLSQQVDIVITYDLRGKRRQRLSTHEGPVYVLSRTDLVAMKRASGRAQDLEDADALERLP